MPKYLPIKIKAMGDLIVILRIIEKLNRGGLVLDSQVEHISDELLKKLKELLDPDAWKILYDLYDGMIESQLNGNDENDLFIDLY